MKKDMDDIWAGRTFRCLDTGEVVTLTPPIRECDFFTVGRGYVDVGRRDFYCRFGGNIEEIKNE